MDATAFGQDLALVGGTIYVSPSEDPIRNGMVLIRGGKIAAAGSKVQLKDHSTQSIDCSGLTITAAFWNSHVHFFERKWGDAANIPAAELGRQLQDAFTRYGFTSVFDLSSPWENTRRIRDRIESGEIAGPRIRATGQGLVPTNPGIPPDAVLSFMGMMRTEIPEMADDAEAATASKKLLDQGVDAVKLFVSGPSKASLSDSIMQAAVTEAHRVGKPVFAHPNSGADVAAAVRSGVDIIAHTTPRSGPWDDALLHEMRERKVAVTPTLALWKYYLRHDRVSVQDQIVNAELGQLKAWVATGGTVLFGTDLGAVDYDPAPEYELMGEAGMDFRQILESLTTAPAERFGDSKRLGRVAAGFDADLVVLNGDPSKNIRALADVRYTLRAGKIIFRAKR